MAHRKNAKPGTLLALSVAATVCLVGAPMAYAEGYVTAANTNCKVWTDDPGNTGITWTPTWVGQCKNGYAEGKGVLEWFNNGVFDQRLDGEMARGKRTGFGTYTWANGNRFEGQFTNNDRTGKGKLIWTNGDVYEGDFVVSKRTGKGKLTWANGDSYEGDFVDGKRTGKGVTVWANGSRYEGDYFEGSRTGQGYLVDAKGNSYRGGWADDTYNGPGVFTRANDGTVLAGQFVAGKFYAGNESGPDGTIIATYSNGVRSQASSSNEGPSALSFVAGLLGAAAQGVAAGGGKNAANYQAIGSALQIAGGGTPTPVVNQASGNLPSGSFSNAKGGTSPSTGSTCNLANANQFQCQCGQEHGQWLGQTGKGVTNAGMPYTEYKCRYSSGFVRACTYYQDSRFDACSNPAIK
ncbi:MORN repeat-containing protein [Pandoraea apista]|uniref:MORN repeat-containing protein n=1 Tax=Pandoraea apista TaxID=93218 RepID=UPI000659D59E|nr:hypothetical protein [Pandoraea apista]ALS63722.1 hypothetical protein AT395_00710 [Pandoraea apista]CFB63258.1 MORN repeat [Pandoraea apista]